LKGLADTLEKITENTGTISHQGQTVFTKAQADVLVETSKLAAIYGKRFKNFPRVTALRFWLWDIGIAGLLTIIAIGFATRAFPSAQTMFCTLSAIETPAPTQPK
jgi:hypothetical protein